MKAMQVQLRHCLISGSCGRDEYRCADGTCIANEFLCDGLTDCADQADEEGCEASELF